MAVAVFCFSNVGLILLHKQLTSLGSTDEEKKDLVALDFRKEGYAAADVESLLSKYGPEGRTTYALYEALDLGVFMWSYAAVLSMMLRTWSEQQQQQQEQEHHYGAMGMMFSRAGVADSQGLKQQAGWPCAPALLSRHG
ncbi:hypothetical protein OEZ86_012545 [Tetradesmus obliquus]|nr:hypothetical protein OEZ86_012545 [Tetradesmus obliquus]